LASAIAGGIFMRSRIIFVLLLPTLAALTLACRPGASGAEQTIQSAKSGDLTITLASATGQLKNGDNDLILSFTDATDKPVDVGAASLNFHMAAMGTMAEMNDRATLTTTDTPGKYRAQVKMEMAGTWEAQVGYQGAHGTGKVSMNVQAK
jgi:hypothetical protein